MRARTQLANLASRDRLIIALKQAPKRAPKKERQYSAEQKQSHARVPLLGGLGAANTANDNGILPGTGGRAGPLDN